MKNREIKLVKYLAYILLGLIFVFGSKDIWASNLGDETGGETEATSPSEKQIFKGEASDRGNHVYQFEFLRGHFGMYVPKLANVIGTYVPENKINKAGKGGIISISYSI